MHANAAWGAGLTYPNLREGRTERGASKNGGQDTHMVGVIVRDSRALAVAGARGGGRCLWVSIFYIGYTFEEILLKYRY